jgi:arylsulfatase
MINVGQESQPGARRTHLAHELLGPKLAVCAREEGSGVKVVFVSMDTLRADRLGCLGYERGLTPALDRIAAEGSVFTRAYASDIPTQPSHTALFTGRFGANTGIVSHFHPPAQLDESISWLPSIFQREGCATGAVDHLFAMKDWFVRGYDDYMPPEGRSRAPGNVVLDIAYPWLQEHHREDFFLFLHFWDAHIPYVPPSPYKERFTAASVGVTDPLIEQRLTGRPTYPLFAKNLYDHLGVIPNLEYVADLYDAEVAFLDAQIARLFGHLDELGVLDETMVVFFGDHGENMTEHDAWFDHSGLYDTVVHVPLIMWAPGLVPAARVSSMVNLVDVKPTVLELSGLQPVEGLDGRCLLPLMQGADSVHRTEVFLSEATWQAKRGVRTEEWKYIRCTDPGVYPRGEPELYHLPTDPSEQHNMAPARPDITSELDAMLATWLEGQLRGRPDPMIEVVQAGLPAVRRLQTLIAELAVRSDAGQQVG